MHMTNSSRANINILNEKGLRENNFANRDYFNLKSDFKQKRDQDKLLKTQKKEAEYSKKVFEIENEFSDYENSLSEVFHEFEL